MATAVGWMLIGSPGLVLLPVFKLKPGRLFRRATRQNPHCNVPISLGMNYRWICCSWATAPGSGERADLAWIESDRAAWTFATPESRWRPGETAKVVPSGGTYPQYD